MAKITKIEAQKNNKDRYSIFLDDKFAFGIHVDVLIKYGLRKGQDLSEDELESLSYDETVKKAVLAGIKHISYKQRTCAEVETKLKSLEMDAFVIQDAIEKLCEMGFLDDLRYAEDFVDTRQKRYGKYRIRQELKKRGIAENIMEETLQNIDVENGFETAYTLAERKYSQMGDIEPAKAANRLQGMLLRKGYDFETIKRIIRDLGIFDR